MPRINASVLWDYFERTNRSEKKATCRLCGDLYNYNSSTGNLKAHLRKKHVDAYEIVESVQVSNRTNASSSFLHAEAEDTGPSFRITTCSPAANSITRVIKTASTPISSRSIKQNRMVKHTSEKMSNERKRKIDRDLLELFIDSYQPFTLVEERAFKKFARWIPGYVLPTRKTISNVMLPSLYKEIQERVLLEINDEISKICLTTDTWTSCINESYVAVTGHYITESFEIKSVMFECLCFEETHTSEDISSALSEITNRYDIFNKINFVVTDNAPNMQKAVSDIGWRHYGCYARSLNLIVLDSLKEVQLVLEKIKILARQFKPSANALGNLTNGNRNILPKRLVQEGPNRWNSILYMLERFVSLEPCIKSTVSVLQTNLPTLSDEEWILCAELCKILKPFDDATKSIGENYMAASSVIVLTRCLMTCCDKLLLEQFSDISKYVIANLKLGLETQFSKVEKSNIFSVCTFLDPRYKMTVFSDQHEAKMTKRKVQDLLVDVIGITNETSEESVAVSAIRQTSKFSPWAIFNEILGTTDVVGTPLSDAMKEIDTYLNDDMLPIFDSQGTWNCPLTWWKNHRHTYPNLAKLMKDYGTIMATSVPCEQIFSKSGLIISDRRTRLTSKKVRQLAFLNVNMDKSRFSF